MKSLNNQEILQVSGGCGPGMFDGLIEGMVALFGVSIVGAIALGAGVTYLMTHRHSHPAEIHPQGPSIRTHQ